MPGNVVAAAPTEVLPYSLSTSYRRGLEVLVRLVEYNDGRVQVGLLATVARRVWNLEKRLTPAQMITYRDFWLARRADQGSFLFSDVQKDSAGGFRPDDAGTQGYPHTFVVRLMSPWEEQHTRSRGSFGMSLIQVG